MPEAAPPLFPTVLRFGRLGDMVMLTALLRLLQHRYGKPCYVVGAGAWNGPVFLGHPAVADSWAFARHLPFEMSLTWPRVLRMLHRSAPGPIYVCEHHPRQLKRVRRLLRFSGIDPLRVLYITEQAGGSDEHWVDRYLRFGEQTPAVPAAGGYRTRLPLSAWTPKLYVLDTERVEREAWLRARGWQGRPLVLVQPGNRRSMSRRRAELRRLEADDKAWPISRWVELLRRVHTQVPDALILLCGAPQEGEMLREIENAAGLSAVASAELPLRQLLALCECAHSLISIDTGPAHAAAALGLPLVVLYGAESPRRWLPRGVADSPILSVGGPPESHRVDQIRVEAVFAAWMKLAQSLERTQPRRPLTAFPAERTAAATRSSSRVSLQAPSAD